MRLSGKRAQVTEAASGIGKAAVSAFVQEAAEVIAADLAFADSSRPNGGSALEMHLDVTDPDNWEELLERMGPLDAVVACAGISDAHSIAQTSATDWRRMRSMRTPTIDYAYQKWHGML